MNKPGVPINGKKGFIWRKKGGRLMAALLMLGILSACSAVEDGQEDMVILEQDEEKISYNLAVARYGDVLLTQNVNGVFEELVGEEVFFPVAGKPVLKVYVRTGDHVKKGQLLVELADHELMRQKKTYEYQIARNETLLGYTQINEDYEISALWLQYLYQSGQTDKEMENLKDRVKEIQQQYQYLREDYQDAISLNQMRLEQAEKELAEDKLYAGVSGTVTWIQDGLDFSVSQKDTGIMKIGNDEDRLFVIQGTKYLSLFEDGDSFEVEVTAGDYAGIYQLAPYQRGKWEENGTMTFSLEGEYGVIPKGTLGKILFVLDCRENVLNLPLAAVHRADGKAFVYCLREDNTREMKWVETGLYGDSRVEIISGLEEGERVVLR